MSTEKVKEAFRILGLSEEASINEVRAKYRLLVLAWHPDRFPETQRAHAENEIKKINAAYELLVEFFQKHQPQNIFIVSCQSCQKSFYSFGEAKEMSCIFCGFKIASTSVKGSSSDKVRGEAVFPVTSRQEDVLNFFLHWIIEDDYTPNDILTSSNLQYVMPVYVPIYLFEVSFHGHWNAEIGIDRWEEYTDYETRYENGRSRQVAVRKQRIVTDWHPHSSGITTECVVVGMGTDSFSNDLVDFFEDVSSSISNQNYNTDLIKGNLIKEFEISPKSSFSNYGESKAHSHIESEIRGSAPGDHIRNISINGDYQYRSHPIFLPFWNYSITYKEQIYNGYFDDKKLERNCGKRPKDLERESLISFIYYPWWILIACFSLEGCNYVLGSIPSRDLPWHQNFLGILFGILIAVWILSALARHIILTKHKEFRKQLLESYLNGNFENINEDYIKANDPMAQMSTAFSSKFSGAWETCGNAISKVMDSAKKIEPRRFYYGFFILGLLVLIPSIGFWVFSSPPALPKTSSNYSASSAIVYEIPNDSRGGEVKEIYSKIAGPGGFSANVVKFDKNQRRFETPADNKRSISMNFR